MCKYCETKSERIWRALVLRTPSNGRPYSSVEMIVMDIRNTVIIPNPSDAPNQVIPFKFCPICGRELNKEA